MLQTVRVFTVAAIGRPPTGLNVGGTPWLGAYRTQEGCRVKGTGTDFHIEWLQHCTALLLPVILYSEDKSLKSRYIVGHGG